MSDNVVVPKVPLQSAAYRRKLAIQAVITPILATIGLDLEPEILASGIGVVLAVIELGYLVVRKRAAKKVAA